MRYWPMGSSFFSEIDEKQWQWMLFSTVGFDPPTFLAGPRAVTQDRSKQLGSVQVHDDTAMRQVLHQPLEKNSNVCLQQSAH